MSDDRTIFEACEDATDEIWDDREAYILAVLKVLRIDPRDNFDAYIHAAS